MKFVPLVVVLVLVLAGGSATPVSADSSAATYHQIALITVPGAPLTSFDISVVERSSQTYYLADRSNKAVDIFDASSNTFETRVAGFVGFTGNNDTSGPNGIVVLHDRGEVWAGDGNSTVKVIDPRTRSRVGLFPVQNCGPAGLTLGPKQQLLLGCGDPTAVQVMDARSGDIVATIAEVSGADEVWYNPGDKHYYVAARNNPSGPVFGVIDAVTNRWIQNVPTGPNAHSIAANPINDEIFVPLRGMGIGVYHR